MMIKVLGGILLSIPAWFVITALFYGAYKKYGLKEAGQLGLLTLLLIWCLLVGFYLIKM